MHDLLRDNYDQPPRKPSPLWWGRGSMKFSREFAMPSANTFTVAPIRAFVMRHLKGISIDPFARNSRLATHTNDLNPKTAALYHLDALAFLALMKLQGVQADT